MPNVLFQDWDIYLNTSDFKQYAISKVVIFKDNKIKIISKHFLDNFREKRFTINGDVKRKLKEDLSLDYNFVVKNDDKICDGTNYTLYINGDLNNYEFDELKLIGDELDIKYYVNGFKCSLCIGWNNKESSKYRYSEFQKAYDDIKTYNIDDVELDDKIKRLTSVVKKYRKAKEIEKTYTIDDYKKMDLRSSLTLEENIAILKGNGFDVKGLI